MTKCQLIIVTFLFFTAIFVSVIEMTIMPKSIQQRLSPVDRAAQLAMDAFLTPVSEVFAFLEAMLVMVIYAIASKRFKDLNILLHVGIVGGFLGGVVAFALMLLTASDTSMATFVLNPSSSTNRALVEARCSLVPTSSALLSHARVYWLLSALCGGMDTFIHL
jgi:hypothetical protein